MRKQILTLAALAMVLTGCTQTASTTPVPAEEVTETVSAKTPYLPVVASEDRPRAIITTDVECDDMNSLIHLSLYFNEVDLDGIVYSASKYHWNGDGEHTLGEINPNYLCEGEAVYKTHTGAATPDPAAADFTHYRDIPEGWIEDLWNNEYREVYEYLSKNDVNYPTPDELLSITKVGNIAFEGDVREATEGSDWIVDAIMDDDPRPLYLFSWGGVNTVVRALLSIYEDNQDNWETVRDHVISKVIISGTGQDNSWADNKIEELYPGIVKMNTTGRYCMFFAPLCTTDDHDPMNMTYLFGTEPDVNYMFRGEWLSKNIKFDHGSLLGRYNLFLDGYEIPNEVDAYQYGLTDTIDWGYDGFPATKFEKYDFIGEGDSTGFMALLNNGLKGMENGKYGSWVGAITYSDEEVEAAASYNYNSGIPGTPNRFLLPYQLDFAARADWCVNDYDHCNHAPVVSVEDWQLTAKAGKPVTFSAEAFDPDGDSLSSSWFYFNEGSIYSGEMTDIRVWTPEKLSTGFTVPADAQPGDYFNLVVAVSDNADATMTRYAQVIVTVAE